METTKQSYYKNYVSSGQSRSTHGKGRSLNELEKDLVVKLKRFLPNAKDSQVLDLGCGSGQFLYVMQKEGYSNTSGVDISEEQVEAALERGVKNVVVGDILDYMEKSEKHFDLILLVDIIEHLQTGEVHRLLSSIRNRLSPAGKVLVHVPNGEGLFGMRIRYGDATHETAFTPRSLHQVFITARFSEVKVFEDKPPITSIKRFLQRVYWEFFSFWFRMALTSESGKRKYYLTQNITALVSP